MSIDIAGNGWAIVDDDTRPGRAYSDFEKFWLKRTYRGDWRVTVPESWTETSVANFAVHVDRYEDGLALVRLGVDTDKTTYLAVVGQLVQIRDDVRLAA